MTDPSNHGSFYFNQLAALQLLVNDQDGALSTIKDYFNGIYMNQIAANGDQASPMPFFFKDPIGSRCAPRSRWSPFEPVHTTTEPTTSPPCWYVPLSHLTPTTPIP